MFLIGSYDFVLVLSLLSPLLYGLFLTSIQRFFPTSNWASPSFPSLRYSFFFFTSFALYYSILFNPLQFALLLSIYPAFAVLLSFFIFHFLLQFYGLRLYIHDFGRFNRGRHYMDIPPFFHFPSCLNFLSSDLFILRAWVCL